MTPRRTLDQLPSRVILAGRDRAPARAMLRAVGLTDEDFERPLIGAAKSIAFFSGLLRPMRFGTNSPMMSDAYVIAPTTMANVSRAPLNTNSSANRAVFSPPNRSASRPPKIRTTEAVMEKVAVSTPARSTP